MSKSEQLNELFSALAKAQAEMDTAAKSSVNPFFKSKYASFTEVVDASRPALTKNGLAVIQTIEFEDQYSFLVSILGHSSGQYISSRIRIEPEKGGVQELGKYITYLKRYAYAALVGVCVGEEDDDGESNRINQRYQQPKAMESRTVRQEPLQVPQSTQPIVKITKEQLQLLEDELLDHPDIKEDVLNKLNIEDLADFPQHLFISSIKRIRAMIATKLEVLKS